MKLLILILMLGNGIVGFALIYMHNPWGLVSAAIFGILASLLYLDWERP